MASNIYMAHQRISRLGQRMSSFQLNLNPLKEPLGFIKILEWIASIFAFATCGGFKGKTEILVSCPTLKVPENKTVTAYTVHQILLLPIPKEVCHLLLEYN
uniref:Synaptophysin like 1 n=1 Tax=Molossus molossus TaxID=27622 RepID=A0A7J8HDP4_MOLMO|nr:synaptophysin like 1 [Molossus molossus]